MSKTTIRTHGNPVSGQKDGKTDRTYSTPSGLSKKETDLLGKKLWNAIWKRSIKETKRLIAAGAPVNWQNKARNSPLHMASYFGKTGIVMLLIEHRANVNIVDVLGNTPLIVATYNNKMGSIRALVEAGADTTILGENNKSAIEWAKAHGYDIISKYLSVEAPRIRFDESACNESGQLYRVKGRSLRAIARDLKENGVFVNHMLHRLKQFCIATHR